MPGYLTDISVLKTEQSELATSRSNWQDWLPIINPDLGNLGKLVYTTMSWTASEYSRDFLMKLAVILMKVMCWNSNETSQHQKSCIIQWTTISSKWPTNTWYKSHIIVKDRPEDFSETIQKCIDRVRFYTTTKLEERSTAHIFSEVFIKTTNKICLSILNYLTV